MLDRGLPGDGQRAGVIDQQIVVPLKHSIVAVDGEGPLDEGDDGVVSYPSAHLPQERATEVVVPSGHSCQEHPRTIAEIRHLLREHLKSLGRR